ncbi:MAG: acyl carrier protein [Verrucomicrobia bacterium]|nr:acyl carrier protein [Verrucomicrobiota bacterium]
MESSATFSSLPGSGLALARGLSAADENALREAMRRCPPAAVEAALQFRRTGDPAQVPVVIDGLIERFVESQFRPRLRQDPAKLRLADDLGIDSLTMMEIVMLAEEVLQVTVNNDELRGLVTLSDVRAFLARKLAATAAPATR